MKHFIPILIASLSTASQAQTLASVELGALFLESTIKGHAEVCKKRIPASQAAWTVAVDSWRERNRDKLEKLHDLTTRLEARYERQETDPFKQFPSPLLTLGLQQIVLSMSSLASANDAEASLMCDRLMTMLSDQSLDSLNVDKVTKTVEAILSRPAR